MTFASNPARPPLTHSLTVAQLEERGTVMCATLFAEIPRSLVRVRPVRDFDTNMALRANSSTVRIRRCQRCGPGSIPGWRILYTTTRLRQYGRVVKAPDLKSGGLCPRGFKSHCCRVALCGLGLVGYDDCLTHSRSRVRFSEPVSSKVILVSLVG